ncbi:MAG: Gfo/Idh/MocA family oxidoreductase [Armatimonadota bacterium]|nr:Gfo/Idh/MocA family oxidoreductase [Armatimonadota bacterium]
MRIGFVDHHLNNYHADKFLSLIRGPLSDLGAEVAIAWESDPKDGDWCEKNSVPRAGSIAEVCQKSDAVFILAPDNIDDHLKLAREVLPYGKPTAIDKALAFKVSEAKEIVELARKHNTPITSSSALAFAVELEDLLNQIAEPPAEVFVTGMGEWKNYGLHTLSMALRVMGPGIKRLIDTGTESSRVVTLDYGDGRKAFVTVRWSSDMWQIFPWTLGIRLNREKYLYTTIQDYDGFYANLMKRVIEFFRICIPPFPGELAMELVTVLEYADQSLAAGGLWVEI